MMTAAVVAGAAVMMVFFLMMIAVIIMILLFVMIVAVIICIHIPAMGSVTHTAVYTDSVHIAAAVRITPCILRYPICIARIICRRCCIAADIIAPAMGSVTHAAVYADSVHITAAIGIAPHTLRYHIYPIGI